MRGQGTVGLKYWAGASVFGVFLGHGGQIEAGLGGSEASGKLLRHPAQGSGETDALGRAVGHGAGRGPGCWEGTGLVRRAGCWEGDSAEGTRASVRLRAGRQRCQDAESIYLPAETRDSPSSASSAETGKRVRTLQLPVCADSGNAETERKPGSALRLRSSDSAASWPAGPASSRLPRRGSHGVCGGLCQDLADAQDPGAGS